MMDTFGAAGIATTTVKVTLKTYTLAELADISNNKTTAAIAGGNADSSKQAFFCAVGLI